MKTLHKSFPLFLCSHCYFYAIIIILWLTIRNYNINIFYKWQHFSSFMLKNLKILAHNLERWNHYPNNLSLLKQKGSNIPSRCAIRRVTLFPEDARTLRISKAEAKKPCQIHFTKSVWWITMVSSNFSDKWLKIK